MATQPICKIDGCDKAAFAKGWCKAHHQRWWRHGDPLRGGKLGTSRGEALHFLQNVVLAYEGNECLLWPYAKTNGYGVIGNNGRSQLVSRIVCEAVHGPPPTQEHEAAHSCGKGHEACCTKGHLSWKTHTGNMADKVDHGTQTRGEEHPTAKLTEAEARQILALKGTTTQALIAARFGVTREAVSRIHRGLAWAWL